MTFSRVHAGFVTWGPNEEDDRFLAYCGLELMGCDFGRPRFKTFEEALDAALEHCSVEKVHSPMPDPFGRSAMPWEMDEPGFDYASGEHLSLVAAPY